MAKTQFHFDITTLNKLILNNIQQFLTYFNVTLNNDNQKYYGCCPIHLGSDNPQALIMYKNSGIWLCTTHHCESTFAQTPIGFIRALLSSKKRGWENSGDAIKMASIKDATDFSIKFLNKDCKPLANNSNPTILIDREKSAFIRQSKLLKKSNILFDIDTFRRYCEIPSPYFVSKGYSPDILELYNVGIMKKQNHQFFNRTVVPIMDHQENYVIGLTARINHPQCLVCSYHHPIASKCLDKTSQFHTPKWEHNFGFAKQNHLFNYWHAKECINRNHSIIITEGPTDCIKLAEAGICNSVALLGSSISWHQSTFIKKCNINKIIIATDNDEGGEVAKESIIKNLGKNYTYTNIELPMNDLGDMNTKQIQELFRYV